MNNQVKKTIPFTVVMLGLVSLFTDAATEMIYPLIPIYVAGLGAGAIILGVIEGVAETTAAMLKLAGGVLSDKLAKRKLLVLIGYGLSSLIRPLTGLVSAAWQIIFVRMLDRVGKGIRTAPRDALIASVVSEDSRGKSYGFHRAMDHAGAVIGPFMAIAVLLVLLVGFHMHNVLLTLRWTFFLSLIPGLLAIMTIIFFVRETAPAAGKAKVFKFSLKQFDRNFLHYLMVVTLFTLGNSSDAFLLFRVEEAIHRSGAVVKLVDSIPMLQQLVAGFGNVKTQAEVINILFLPLIWAFFHVIKVIFSTPFGALSDRIGRKIVINIGWAVYALVYSAFALLIFLPSHWQVLATFILFAVYALYYAFTEGAEKAFVADMVGEQRRGSAFGMYNFAIGLGALPASLIFGFLYSFFDHLYPGYGGLVAFGFGALVALISMVLLMTMVKETAKQKA